MFSHIPIPLKGSLLSILAFLSFSSGDALLKHAGTYYHTYTLGFFAALAAFISLIIFSLFKKRLKEAINPKYKKLQAIRALCATGVFVCFLYGIKYQSLAVVYTLMFTMPFFLIIFSALFMKEKVRRWDIAIVFIGFIGVLIALRPFDAAINLALLAALAAGFLQAIVQFFAKFIPKDEHWLSFNTPPYLFQTLTFAIIMVFYPQTFVIPDVGHLFYISLAGILLTLGLVILTIALRMAPVISVAPFHYTQIIWGAAFGYIFFRDTIDIWTAIGATIIIGSGLFLLFSKERTQAEIAEMGAAAHDANNPENIIN